MTKFKVKLKDGRYVFYHARKKVSEYLLIKLANQLEAENNELKITVQKQIKKVNELRSKLNKLKP